MKKNFRFRFFVGDIISGVGLGLKSFQSECLKT